MSFEVKYSGFLKGISVILIESFIDVLRSFRFEFVRLLEGASVLFCSIEFAREVDAVSFVIEAEEFCGTLLELSFRRGDIELMEELV